MQKLLDVVNNGINITMDKECVYIRCENEIIKYSLIEEIIQARTTLFKKDGKARYITNSINYLCVLDFCDLYILNKTDLTIVKHLKIGNDASTDLLAARCDDVNIYISIRNGIIGVLNIKNWIFNQYKICDESSWELTLSNDKIYFGTTSGILYEIDKNNMEVIRHTKVGNKNIYGIVTNDKYAYTISQDKTIKAINLATFEVELFVNKAINGMCKILGLYNDYLVIADCMISIWNINNLIKTEKIELPTGHFNKGACLYQNILIGSDYNAIYKYEL